MERDRGDNIDQETMTYIDRLLERLESEPDLLDNWFDKLPAELSFVLRQLPSDREMLRPFLGSVAPLMLKEEKYGSPLNDGDKIDLFLDVMGKPECFEWIVRAILGKDPDETDESTAPAWLEKTRDGMHALEEHEFEHAHQLLTEALEESDKITPDSLWSFAIMRALVAACAGTGRLEEAEPLATRWIAAGEARLGKWHPDLSYPYSILAHVRELQNNSDEAESLHKHSVEIVEKSKGTDHQDLIPSLDSMAYFYSRREDLEVAGEIFRRILAIHEAKPEGTEEDREEYLEALLEIDLRLKHFASAEAYARRVLELRKNMGLADTSQSGIIMGLLASCLLARQRMAEAEVVFERANELFADCSLEDNEKVAFVFESYIEQLRSSNEQDKALECEWLARRMVYKNIEFSSQGCEIMARTIPVIISADVVYRLCTPVNRKTDDIGFITESEDEISAHIHARLVRELQDYFEGLDFLRVLTDIDDLQDDFVSLIGPQFADDGLELDFAFRTFADSAGFLDVLRKVHNVDELSVNKGIDRFEDALTEALAFKDSDISEFVRSAYVAFLEEHDEMEKAAEVRNRLLDS